MSSLILLAASAVCCAATPAAISGVVRDADGVAQMGAVVQVLAAGSVDVASVLTDMHGRYSIANLLPGSYQVRVSSAWFAVGARRNLRLSKGMLATVNLTLSMVADPAAWLPASRRGADESGDDWTWTLRATANRPILRLVGNDDAPRPGDLPDGPHRTRLHGRLAVVSGAGGFGTGGVHTVGVLDRASDADTDVMLRADIGAPNGTGGEASRDLAVGYQRSAPIGGSYRVMASYADHPEMSTGGTSGMQVLRIANARKIELGDSVELEAGGTVYAIHTSGTAFTTQPFLRVTLRPNDAWAVGYQLATSRDVQGFDDLDSLGREVPVAGVAGRRIHVESGMHQQLSVSRRMGDGAIEAAVFHNAMDHPAIAGMGAMAPEFAGLGGVMLDTTTGSFRLLGTAYTSDGVSLALSEPLTRSVWVTLKYERGSALAARGTEAENLAQVSAGLHAESGDAVTASVKGKVLRTGTRVRAAYCWQPEAMVTSLDAYDQPGGEGYLSFYVGQPLRWAGRLPAGLEARIDVKNLLAQGYRPFVSPDGHTLFLAQSPRTLQAGLSFTF